MSKKMIPILTRMKLSTSRKEKAQIFLGINKTRNLKTIREVRKHHKIT